MKKITLIIVLAMISQFVLMAQESITRDYRYTVHFDLDKDKMTSHAKLSLEKRLAEYFGQKVISISIIGHTDIQGGDDYNIDLSRRRSETIKDFMVQNGFANIPIDIQYKGEYQPKLLGESKTIHANNRRVEIWFYIQEEATSSTTKSWKEVSRTTTLPDYDKIVFPERKRPQRQLTSFEQFHQSIDVETQYFDIKNNTKNVVEGKKGTIIYFPKSSFCDCNNKEEIQGDIQLELREYYSMGDFIRGGYSTMNNDKVLQSAGTIDLIAKKDNEEVCLKERQEYQIFFPKYNMNEEVYPDMQLFSGNVEEDGTVNWGVMARNTLKNKQALEYQMNNPDGCGRAPFVNNVKWKFFKRVNKFIFKHQDWKGYKFRRSASGLEQIAKTNAINDLHYQICIQSREDALNGITRSYEEMLQYLESNGYDKERLVFDYYFMSSVEMAKINIDRFYKKYENREQIVIDLPMEVKDKRVAMLVCKRDNMVFNATRKNNGQYTFVNIPKGLDVKIVTYDYSSSNPSLAVVHTKSGKTISPDQLQLQSYTKEEFKKRLVDL